MKILIISPSAGDSFYCGNCFRDSLQASALIKAGHDVTILPLYLPTQHATNGVPIFFSAVSYYIEQTLFKKGNMPKWITRLCSSKLFLRLAASMSGTTSAKGMEGITMSMITGRSGAFKSNVSKLINWIEQQGKPDIIHLSSSLLIGMAAPIKQQLNLPVVCSLQDEEVWIDSLQGEWSKLAWEAIETNTSYVDAFITTSNYYKSIATKKVPSLNPTVIYPGINIKKYYQASLPQNPTIGFFYRMNDLDGLDTLAKAFVMLKQRGSIPNLKLRIGGGNTGSDNKFLTGVRNILSPYMDDVIIEQEYSPMAHHRFYKEVSIVSVPLQFDEGVGLYICEAYAAGRPVVEPHRGSFPEIVGEGGLLYSDESAEGLAEALEQMLTSQSLYESKRQAACALAQERYSDKECATKLIDVYTRIMN